MNGNGRYDCPLHEPKYWGSILGVRIAFLLRQVQHCSTEMAMCDSSDGQLMVVGNIVTWLRLTKSLSDHYDQNDWLTICYDVP